MYYIIVNPNSKHVSFCNEKKDICFGDTVPNIIPNYTNQQYANDFGDRVISVPCNTETDPYKAPRYDGFEQMTIREYMQVNCRMDITNPLKTFNFYVVFELNEAFHSIGLEDSGKRSKKVTVQAEDQEQAEEMVCDMFIDDILSIDLLE